MYEIVFSDVAESGLMKLLEEATQDVIDDFYNQMDRITHLGKKAGLPLENKHGIDLERCFKIYFGNTRYRIVYEEEPDGGMLILSVGERDELSVYRDANKSRNGGA